MAALPPIVVRMAEAAAGTLSHRDLVALGYPRELIRWWVDVGLIERKSRGEYRVLGSEETERQRVQLYLNRAGPGARIAGPLLLARYKIKGFADVTDDHIAVSPDRRVTGVKFKVVRTPLPEEDWDEVDGQPAVTVARGLVGAAKTYRPARIRVAVDHAKFLGLTSEAEIAACVTRLGQAYGAPQMGRIINSGALKMESEPERDLSSVFRPGDPLPLPQVYVQWHGRYFRLDFAYLDGRLDIEYDGGGHVHRREPDADRDLALAELQIQTLRITKAMMRDPEGTRRRILAVLDQRRALALPPIVPDLPPWAS